MGKGKTHDLVCFGSDSPLRAVASHFEISESHIFLEFRLSGSFEDLNIIKQKGAVGRKDNLWENTCLELFLLNSQTGEYIEINISPWGDWNCYLFSCYRKDMRAYNLGAPWVKKVGNLGWKLTIDRPHFSFDKINIAAVLKYRSGTKEYWALSHPGSQPDFHNESAFLWL